MNSQLTIEKGHFTVTEQFAYGVKNNLKLYLPLKFKVLINLKNLPKYI